MSNENNLVANKKSRTGVKMPKEREDAIIKAYQDGMNISDIEKKFETGRRSIYRIIERNKVKLLNNFTKSTDKPHTDERNENISVGMFKKWQERKNNEVVKDADINPNDIANPDTKE